MCCVIVEVILFSCNVVGGVYNFVVEYGVYLVLVWYECCKRKFNEELYCSKFWCCFYRCYGVYSWGDNYD